MANAYLQGVEISASQFLDIFHHYDNDGNGYIEGKELQNFIKELQQARKQAGLVSHSFLQSSAAYWYISIRLEHTCETSQEDILLITQCNNNKNSIQNLLLTYDADHSGYIEADELKNFLKDLLQRAKKPYDEKKLEEYTMTTLKIFDSNKDGKLCLSEMARLLPDQENFLLKFQGVKMSRKDFNKIFELYDQDKNGYMDENELDALLKDLCEKNNKVLEVSKIPTYKSAIMALSDGGKLYRTELALVLCAEEM
uniref:Calbindin n=1 Tax=Cyprinus carpio carpio TaxID=630221 RepID=A0A9J7XTT9_CYPCA